jgi:hypothetical protein
MSAWCAGLRAGTFRLALNFCRSQKCETWLSGYLRPCWQS